MDLLHEFKERQLAAWPEAGQRYNGLRNIQTKEINIDGMNVRIQFNPSRAVSTLARTDADAIQARPCFLCGSNRPRQQEAIPFEGCDGHRYAILVNPFPIFPEHYTVPAVEHTPQRIGNRFPDMLRLAETFPDMVVFYNGPESGASAPDHFHFQMGCKGFLPVETQFDCMRTLTVMKQGAATISVTSAYIPGLPVISAPDAASATAALSRVLRSLTVSPSTGEPKLNILCWTHTENSSRIFRIIVIPRKVHRPSCYYAPEDQAVRISPASVDLGGVFIVPLENDFKKTGADTIMGIIRETVDTSWQPVIDVGLLTAPEIRAKINGCEEIFTLREGQVEWNGECYGRLEFRPSESFTLHKVKIGINFHWEREEDQIFPGGLTILPTEDGLVAINSVLIEDYLLSVISSEMNGDAPEEFLKAHAVISRSWLLARPTLGGKAQEHTGTESRTEKGRIVRWYDREDHTLFDVCADDHCQRYQGLHRAGNPNIRRAIEATMGQVLTDRQNGDICDTRFSKCCGGISERFSTCWADEDYSYLQPVRDCQEDREKSRKDTGFPDLSREDNARRWILSSPEAFCNTSDHNLLSTVLNSYDRETADFYRWKTEYTQAELSSLLHRRSGIDFGYILELRPLRRGASGRIIELLIRGTRNTVTVGKELEIRRWLSESHLYSSAFTVDTEGTVNTDIQDVPARFILHGAGWGHGVGLCQIGAAAMSARGYTYDRILAHYFPDSCLTGLYRI